jgi:hypothetical protein
MLSTGQIVFLVVDVLLAAAGWIVFAVFQDGWKSLRTTPDDRREWLLATIGLVTGIVASVALVIFALVVGALAAKQHAKDRLLQIQKTSRTIPTLSR